MNELKMYARTGSIKQNENREKIDLTFSRMNGTMISDMHFPSSSSPSPEESCEEFQ